MKATGIVRRIDDLGRVVIPKEIRRVMQLRDGAPLEIFVGDDGSVIFKKFSALSSLEDKARQLADAILSVERLPAAVVDRERVIASSGSGTKALAGLPITDELDKLLLSRTPSELRVALCKDSDVVSAFAVPIISQSELVGGLIIPDEGNHLSEASLSAVRIAAALFANLLD